MIKWEEQRGDGDDLIFLNRGGPQKPFKETAKLEKANDNILFL